MCGVTTLVVSVRLLFRWKSNTLGLDDYAFVPSIVSAHIAIQCLIQHRTYWSASWQLCYWGWSIMAIYVNLHAGVGKPLWEITLREYSIWFKVRQIQLALINKIAAFCSS